MLLHRLNINLLMKSSVRSISTTPTSSKSFKKRYQEFWTPKRTNLPPYGHFTQIGDPVLRQIAAPVPEDCINNPEIDAIVNQMIKVLRKYDCVGIAAPQIGISLRIIVMEFKESILKDFPETTCKARKMSPLPLSVFINPTLKITNYEKHKHPEGCMSVRGFSAEVERYEGVSIIGVGKLSTPSEVHLNGWNARIAQHEMDHLDGKLYTDHMDRSTLTCTCWETINTKSGRVEIPFYK